MRNREHLLVSRHNGGLRLHWQRVAITSYTIKYLYSSKSKLQKLLRTHAMCWTQRCSTYCRWVV